jgi:hypothetical protein
MVTMMNTATGSRIVCPLCKGTGTVERWEDPRNCWSGYYAMCPACPVAGVLELPVSPEAREAIGEELLIASGLEWDGVEGDGAREAA